MTSPIPIPSGPGRKQKYQTLDRLKLALAALRGSSINSSSEIVSLSQASSFEELNDLDNACKHTTIQSLCELYQCYKTNLAYFMSQSNQIALVLDATTDSGREILAVFFAGSSSKLGEWSSAYGVVETRGHQAELQVFIVKQVISEINSIQVKKRKKRREKKKDRKN